MAWTRLLLTLGSIVALTACNPDKEGATDTEAGTTEAGTETESTGSAPEVCACVEPEEFGVESFTCGGWSCPMLAASCEEGPTGATCGGGFDIDEAALACVLDALIAGDEGLLAWTFTPDGNVSVEGGFVAIQAGRSGLARTWLREDLAGENSPAGVVALKDAAYFEACKAEPDLKTRFECAVAWSDEAPTAQCAEAESFSFS